MRHTTFTQNDITNKCRSSITTNPSFQFNMNDMARIRREMKEVIQNLIKPFQEGKHHAEEGNNDKGKGSKGEDVPSSITMNQHVKGQDQDDKCVSCDDGEMKQDSSSADPHSTHSMTSSERAKKEQVEVADAIAKLRFAVAAVSRTGKKERKFEIKCVSQKGRQPRCNLCSELLERGDPHEEDQSWHVITGGKHYCMSCMEHFSSEEKRRIWGMIQNRKGEIGDGVQETFQENMQMWKEFECFAHITEDGRNATLQND